MTKSVPETLDLSTKELLIVTAERLFALNTVQGVSLRQINEAANQKNSSAVHYHFESKDGIVQAVLDYRMKGVDKRRGEMLASLLAGPKGRDLRSLISVLVLPAAAELTPRPEGNYYLRFLEQLTRHREVDLPQLLTGYAGAWIEAEKSISALLAWLPPAVAKARMATLGQQSVFWLAAIEADIESGSTAHKTVPFKVECAIDAMHAMLIAPVSSEALLAAQDAGILSRGSRRA